MTIDKRMSYVNQDGYQNYTKNSDSVTVPRKFKSRADATPTKLAYITAAEEKQLKKQNKGTPHKGPSGIPSYDDFDAQGSYRSGAAMSAAETGGRTERARADMRQAGIGPAEAQALRSAAINAGAGQRVNPGFFDSRTHLTPQEIRAARNARRDPTNKYGAQSYRNTGQGGILGLLRSGGIFGNLLRGLGQKFGLGKKYNEPTYDMSEFNNLPLGGTGAFENLDIRDKWDRRNAKIKDTAFSKTVTPNTRAYGPWTQGDIEVTGLGDQETLDELAAEESSRAWDNFVPPTGTNYPGNVGLARPGENTRYGERGDWGEWFDTHPATGESVLSGAAQNMIKSGTAIPAGVGQFMGDTVDWAEKTFDPFNQKEINIGPSSYDARRDNAPSDQEIFNERFVDASTGSPYTSAQDNLLMQHGFKPAEVGNWSNNEGLNLINNLTNWNTRVADGGRIGYANGGLASLFTRRG